MRAFEYAAPKNLHEAFRLLASSNGTVRAMVGGTDLIVQVKDGVSRPALVMDVKGIPELTRLEYDPTDGLHLGAAVPCARVAGSPVIREKYPALAQACALIGSIQIQNRATVGGNVCNAAPSADSVPPLLVYEARAVIAGPRGPRQVPLETFFKGPRATDLARDEILLELVLPPPLAGSNSQYLRFSPREEMDIAIVGVGALVALEPGTRRLRRARIALGAVAPTPLRATAAEASLEGQEASRENMTKAGALAAAASRPINDVRGSAEYRRELVQVLTRRTLGRCLAELGVEPA